MKHPLISVIIPVYNVEKFINDCVESLIHQTMKDIEYIFVDDMSTDSSVSILKEYELKYNECISVIILDRKMRQGGARNVGIRHAKGDYIGFVDSDDFVHPMMFESLYSQTNHGEADVVFCDMRSVDEDSSYDRFDFNHVDHIDDEIINMKNDIANSHIIHEYPIDDEKRCDLIALGIWGGYIVAYGEKISS